MIDDYKPIIPSLEDFLYYMDRDAQIGSRENIRQYLLLGRMDKIA